MVDRGRLRVETLGGRLHALSPLATLGRGYTLTTNANDQLVTRAAGVEPGDAIRVQFVDGHIEARTERVVAREETA